MDGSDRFQIPSKPSVPGIPNPSPLLAPTPQVASPLSLPSPHGSPTTSPTAAPLPLPTGDAAPSPLSPPASPFPLPLPPLALSLPPPVGDGPFPPRRGASTAPLVAISGRSAAWWLGIWLLSLPLNICPAQRWVSDFSAQRWRGCGLAAQRIPGAVAGWWIPATRQRGAATASRSPFPLLCDLFVIRFDYLLSCDLFWMFFL